MSERGTVSTVLAKRIVAAAALRGAPLAELLSAVGVTTAELEDQQGRVSQEQFHHLWREAARLTGDPDFGLHLAEMNHRWAGNALYYAVSSCATFEHVLDCLDRYGQLAHDALVVTRREEAGRAWVRFVIDHPLGPERQGIEFALARIALHGQTCLPGKMQIRALSFTHEGPASTAEHRRIFGIAPRFGQPHSEIAFDAALLRHPLDTHDPRLHSHLGKLLDQLLAQLDTGRDLQGQLERLVAERLKHGVPDIEDVARALKTSSRTLQRRLHQEGTSFLDVVNRARQKLAGQYLREPSLSLTEIAFLLGFTEPSNFHRAFKRWTGRTPMEARRGVA